MPRVVSALGGWARGLAVRQAISAALLLTGLLASGCGTADLPGAGSVRDGLVANGGYTATGAELSATDENGQPRFTLKAGGIAQQQSTQPVQLTQVEVRFPSGRGQNWTLTASSGQISASGNDKPNIVDFAGDVRLLGQAGTDGARLELLTATLRYDSSQQLATTRDRVTLQSGDRRLQARGMTANLTARRVRLESEVHGRFTP